MTEQTELHPSVPRNITGGGEKGAATWRSDELLPSEQPTPTGDILYDCIRPICLK